MGRNAYCLSFFIDMKILTNIKFVQTAGIAQILTAFLDFVKNNKSNALEVVAVNVKNSLKPGYRKSREGNVSVVSIKTKIPGIQNVLAKSKTLKDVKKKYAGVIEAYRKAIRKEKPDLVLLNGTYYLPWCLFLASKMESVPVVLHYHGVLTVETRHWLPKYRKLFKKMEQSFDSKDVFYIFPSKITKNTVEQKIYGHKIKRFAVVPNPVPMYFFDNTAYGNKINIGIVSRWDSIKNVDFCRTLAEYNKRRGGEFVINLITDLKEGCRLYKKLSKIMKIHPVVKNDKLVDFYKNMGVVISPSHFETYGNVAKEALASGIPAVVNYNMGVSETFEKLGLREWVIDFKSPSKVYKKIKDTIGNKVRDEVREKIKVSYSPQKIFTRIIDVLESAYLSRGVVVR